MSLEPARNRTLTPEGDVDPDAVLELLGELVLDTDEHLNADQTVVVRPDDVEETLLTLRDEAGFDHCSCLTAQEYEDRYESIYHLKQYDDPTNQVSVVVPTTKDEPVSQSGTAAYRTNVWHEREAYDLVGIEYDDHPDLRRILLPETWQGHPLAMDYDKNGPQVVTLGEHDNPLKADEVDEETETMFLNVGPHHPATHGVLHVETVLDGETVADVRPDIGYLHRCEEQMAQNGTYRHQIMPYPDRWDYTANMTNEFAYARAAEDLADIDVPEYAQILRVLGVELSRMTGHFLALGTFALDVYGDFTAIFQYAFRDREVIMNILEDLTGQRMMYNYFRLGGVCWDVPRPREDFFEKTRDFLDDLPEKLEEYHDLLTSNEIFQLRCVDTGILEPEVAKSYGVTGPVARGSGIDYDVRRDDPYGYYENLDWDVVTEDGCDNYARVLVRMQELEESAKMIGQCIDLLEQWPEDERTLQSNVPRTLKPEADRETYQTVEAAKGELGVYIRSDGTDKPGRFKIRSPCFSNLQALPEMATGEFIPDLIASLGSLDIVLGEVDR